MLGKGKSPAEGGPKRGLGPDEHPGWDPGAYPSAGDESGACAQECGPPGGAAGEFQVPPGREQTAGTLGRAQRVSPGRRVSARPRLGRLPALSGKRGLHPRSPGPVSMVTCSGPDSNCRSLLTAP